MTKPRRKQQLYPQPVSLVEGKPVRVRQKLQAKNYSQELYLESLRTCPVTLSHGPAGSGKTYLVTGIALEKLLNNEVEKIVFTRPVVESDEKLGYLPGTLEQKLDPYLLPLFDAVKDHVGPGMAEKIMANGKIEIAPLAYMRGRTFNNSYVVLDEAQNCTVRQMKMFLTRMGVYSYFSINGDATQTDLQKPRGDESWETGLQYAIRKLAGKHPDISYIEFTTSDVVRSEICKIVLTYLDTPEPRRLKAANEK